MDSQTINQSIDYVGCWGIVLSAQRKAALQTSLFLLKNRQNFSRVQFWGKITGIEDDYYIAQGFSGDQLASRKYLYSKNCVSWNLLNPATEENLSKSRLIRGRFTGDPSYEFHHTVKHLQLGSEEKSVNSEVITLKEEDRLAAVIADIDHDVYIVPRRSFIKSSTGDVYQNRMFEGHSLKEAMRLYNYVHLRKSEIPTDKLSIDRADFDQSLDFLDGIDTDVPKGSWSVQHDRASGLVSVKSLLWLGYFFYHLPNTSIYGSLYVGTGEKNIDLPFML